MANLNETETITNREEEKVVEGLFDAVKANKQAIEIARENDDVTTYPCDGVALLKNCTKGETRNGKPKFSGIVTNQEEVSFNVWNNSQAYEFLDTEKPIPGREVVRFTGEIGKYGLCINTMGFVEGYDPDGFVRQRYELEQMNAEFLNALKASGITAKAKELLEELLHMYKKDEFGKRICREYAARSHHDNCRSGLLAHMTKCIQLYNGIKAPYKFLQDERINDLMVIALAIHDIGKLQEMHNGEYQKYSYVTHRGFGLEYLAEHKEYIMEKYDEEFYYMLFSVIQQHHGEFGEKLRTVYALVSHLIDDMDAKLTWIDQMIEDKAYVENGAGTVIRMGEDILSILQPHVE